MSDERSEPSYHLRSRRVRATTPSEGFIRASDLLRRRDELESGGVCQADPNHQEAASNEVVSHLSADGHDEGGSTATTEGASAAESSDQGCADCSGEAQGQPPTPPCSPLVEEAAHHQRPTLLRLRVQEAWKLHGNEVWLRQCQLSEEGGFHANCVWNNTRALFEHPAEATKERYCWQAEEVDGLDRDIVAIGVFTRRHHERVPRVLLVEQAEGGQFTYHVAAAESEALVKEVASKPFVSRNKLFYTTARRVVQLEYQLQETFQTEAALLVWATQQQEDNLSSNINGILYFCTHSDGRGLVRPLYGPRAAAVLYRRVQGSKKDTVAKRVSPGKPNAYQKKVRDTSMM